MARLWIDATSLKVRQGGQIVSVALTLAVGVNTDGRREVLGMAIGASEAFAGKQSPGLFSDPAYPSGPNSCAVLSAAALAV